MATERSRRLRLLGPFQARVDNRALMLPHSGARLLALLVVTGPSSRSGAVAKLWPDADLAHGAASLRSAMARLNAIDPGFLEVSGEVLAVPDSIKTDVDDLLEWVNGMIYASGVQAITSPPPQTTGRDLLPGWDESWLVAPRERLRLLEVQALETAAERLIAAGRAVEALPYALSAVEIQPWSESANRILIEIHARRGDPSNALRRYRRFRAALESELGVQPGPDILALIRQLYPFGTDPSDQTEMRSREL